MKQKEIKNLAKKIAQQELKLQKATSLQEKNEAENEIIKLSSKVNSIEDMVALDEAIQDLLMKNS